MFQKDRDELIEESKTELETLERKLISEHELQRDKDIKMSVEQTQLSAKQKMDELNERIKSLEHELQDAQTMIAEEVEYVFECSHWTFSKIYFSTTTLPYNLGHYLNC